VTQRYRNAAVGESAKDKPALPLHDEFTYEQNGTELTVVDQDGSVYKGNVRPTPVAADDRQQAAANAHPTAQVEANLSAAATDGPTQAALGQGFQVVETPASQPSLVAQQAPAQVTAQNYVFRVEGTNRSLKQRVVFVGTNFVQSFGDNAWVNAGQNALNASTTQQQLRFQNNAKSLNTVIQSQIGNNFINGRVMLGNSKSGTELNAISVEPEGR
jgi:hypothetical protein